MTANERRRAVRSRAKLAMEIKLRGKDYGRVESLNVSANGVYFSSSLHIPVLTKLGIVLVLPLAGDDASGGKREVACEGVVVRTVPETPQEGAREYQIACYFTRISDKDKEYLDSYILNQLAF